MTNYFVFLIFPDTEQARALGESEVQSLADIFEEDENVLATVTQRTGESEHERDESEFPWMIKWIVQNIPDLDVWVQTLNAHISQHKYPNCLSFQPTDLKTEPLPEINWVQESLEKFKPFKIPPFYIYGSHSDLECENTELFPLQINASIAFGTGQHPTTKGCLEKLYALYKQGHVPKTILDMGTGSGILAIAAARLWPEAIITAVDNDPDSISVTQDHIRMNEVKNIHALVGNGFDPGIIEQDRKFDLIIANILARPLKEMAQDLSYYLCMDGKAVLSGILDTQASDISAQYSSVGMTLKDHSDFKNWSTLVFQKSDGSG